MKLDETINQLIICVDDDIDILKFLLHKHELDFKTSMKRQKKVWDKFRTDVKLATLEEIEKKKCTNCVPTEFGVSGYEQEVVDLDDIRELLEDK